MIQQKRYFFIEPTFEFLQLCNKPINIVKYLLETANQIALFNIHPIARLDFDEMFFDKKPVMSHKGVNLPTNKEITLTYCCYLHAMYPDIYDNPNELEINK